MISSKLMGGLGNQMFQIAAAHALALRNNTESGFDLSQCYTPAQGNKASKYRENIFKNINDVSINANYINNLIYDDLDKIYKENSFSYNEIPFIIDIYMIGYFQSEKYFLDYKNEILNLFSITDTTLVNDYLYGFKFMNRPITAVHVRRGDYLNHPEFHPVLSIKYYQEAMKQIGDSSFIFISDDMEWVKNNFRGPNIWYSNFTDEINDFKLLTLCDNNIIANSSFSWWGAYLNKNPNKKIIAPKKWFGPLGPQDTQDLIPSDWSII